MIRIIISLLLLFSVAGANTIDSVGPMMDEVRQLTSLESTTLLPDSTLRACCMRALVWVSTEIGGVEVQHRIMTVEEQAFYALPDSMTQIVFLTMRTQNGVTKSLKAWYPQYLEETGITEGDPFSTSEDDLPYGYNHWADSLQLMPAPVTAGDTIILKIYVEHKTMANDSTADTMRLSFTGDVYSQAALYYACSEALRTVKLYDESKDFMAEYDKRKKSLQDVFTRRFDIPKQ